MPPVARNRTSGKNRLATIAVFSASTTATVFVSVERKAEDALAGDHT